MKWLRLLSRNKQVDERIVNIRNQIYKETHIGIMILCSVSILIKYICYGPNLGNVATELVITFASALYFAIRSISLGLYADEVEIHDRSSKLPMSLKNVFISLGIGILIAVFFGVRSAVEFGQGTAQSFKFFIIVFLASFLIYVPFIVGIVVIGHTLANKFSKKVSTRHENEADG